MVEDDVLISRARSGDEQAFVDLMQAYHAFVYAIVVRMVKNSHDAEDLVQEAFINVYKGLSQLEDATKFKSWLAEVARNCARNWLRKQRIDTVPIDEVSADTLQTSESPGAQLIRDEQIELIRRALKTLPEKDRKIALAYYLDGASYDELIRAHGLSYKAISFRLSRAKRTLTNRLGHQRTGVIVPPTTAQINESGGLTAMKISPMGSLQDNEGWLVTFLPNGKYLAGLNNDNSLREWNIENGKKIGTYERVTGHGETISLFRGRTLKVSSEGTYLAISSSFDNENRDIVTLWNGETTASFRHETTVVSAAVSPDSKLLATGGWDRAITLWSLETGKPIRTLSGHTGEIHTLAFSPDGQLLASSGAYDWEYQEDEDGSTLRRDGTCYAFRSDGGDSIRFYSADDSKTDTTAKVWEIKSGKNIATLGHQRKVTQISFSPDGNYVATASGKQVNIWRTKTWKAIVTLNTVEVGSLAFSPEGNRLAIGGSRDEPIIQICDVDTGRYIAELSGHTGGVQSVAFSPDGRLLASGGFDSAIYLWNVE